MATVSLPYTLQAGQPENVNQLVANLNALVAGVNTVDTAQIASGSVTQAKLADGVFAPIGSIMQYAGSTAPTNWLLCDGDAVSRSTYADLFTALGTTYGSGNGSTTFNVPNLKGRAPVGRDSGQTEFDSLGETGGAKTHTLTTSELAAHNHGVTDPGHAHDLVTVGPGTAGTANVLEDRALRDFYEQRGGLVYSNTTGISIQNAGGGGAHNNLQPYLVLNYIIRAL